MPLEIDATPAGETSNSYADLDDAAAILAYEPDGELFTDLTDDAQVQWLVKASSSIDTLEHDPGLKGDRYDDDQAMAFPRDEAELAPALVRATVLYAHWLAKRNAADSTSDPLNPDPNSGNIRIVDVPGAKVEFFGATGVTATALERFPHEVFRLLQQFLYVEPARTWGTGEVVRSS